MGNLNQRWQAIKMAFNREDKNCNHSFKTFDPHAASVRVESR
jgi:hypothetical protein